LANSLDCLLILANQGILHWCHTSGMKAFIYVRVCVLAVQHLFIFRGLVFGAAHNATLHVNFTIFKADIFEARALPLPP
jgi:hypothetical protein